MQNPIAIYSLIFGAATLYWLVIVVIEATLMQLLGWGELPTSLRASILANLASAIPLLISFLLIPQQGFLSILIGFLIVFLVETVVLKRLKPDLVQNLYLVVFLTNLISYGILILPIYFFVR